MTQDNGRTEALLRIARAASHGLGFVDRMEGIWRELTAALPLTSAAAGIFDPTAMAPAGPDLLFLHNRELLTAHRYASEFAPLDPFRPAYLRATGEPVVLSDHPHGRKYGSDPFTADFLAPLGIRHVLGCSHRLPDGRLFMLTLHRDGSLDDFGEADRAFFAAAHGELVRAAVATTLRQSFADRLPPRTVALVAFDARGGVVEADLSAHALVAAVRGGTAALREAALAHLEHRPAPALAAGTLDVVFIPAEPASGVALIAALVERRPDRAARLEDLGRRHGLTRRERACTELAARGLSNTEIARELGVGVDAVKFHLKGVFKKLGVKTRAQLTAKLLGD